MPKMPECRKVNVLFLLMSSLSVLQFFSIPVFQFRDMVDKDVAVNFEELAELTVIPGLPAHSIVSRCITKEFRDAVFKYMQYYNTQL